MGRIIQQGFFVMRFRYLPKISGAIRKMWFSVQGMKIGTATHLPKLFVTWPHQVIIGNHCILEELISFKFDGIRKPGPCIRISDHVFIGSGCEFNIRLGIDVGEDSLIASGCRFIDHDHGIEPGVPMRSQHGPEKAIKLGKDVWLGCNVVVLKGVEIGDSAVIAAGAVVTKSIPPGEIWGGVPAKKIGERKK